MRPSALTLPAAALAAGLLLSSAAPAAGAVLAHADLGPASGSNASGTVTITAAGAGGHGGAMGKGADSMPMDMASPMPMGGGLHLEVSATGLSPGVHGFHVHEVGDCSAPDASSAKGHFNPAGKPHGSHAGDLPDLTADASGAARLSVDVSGLDLGDGPNSIAGRAFVIHADPDDRHSQPAGNSGKRIACGVIRLN
jgi:Cu-Zn family superoxide dismutase